MKKLFFLSTRLSVFWVELPPIAILIPSIINNRYIDTLMKLYPLIFAMSLLIVFFALYFFKAVVISNEEIRCVSAFNRGYIATIKEDRTLAITLLKKNRIRLELFGKNDDGESSYAWLQNEEPAEINLFRAKINGGQRQVRKILRFFKADENKINELTESDVKELSTDDILVSSSTVNGLREIKIYFKNTL